MRHLAVHRLTDEGKVIGEQFCSGFTDSFGKWNTGFFCPDYAESKDVYCCGTNTFKYCCTKKGEEQHELLDVPMVVGIVFGCVVVTLVITVLSCFLCSCCLVYKRRQGRPGTSTGYQMHPGPNNRSSCTESYNHRNSQEAPLVSAASYSPQSYPCSPTFQHQSCNNNLRYHSNDIHTPGLRELPPPYPGYDHNRDYPATISSSRYASGNIPSPPLSPPSIHHAGSVYAALPSTEQPSYSSTKC